MEDRDDNAEPGMSSPMDNVNRSKQRSLTLGHYILFSRKRILKLEGRIRSTM